MTFPRPDFCRTEFRKAEVHCFHIIGSEIPALGLPRSSGGV